MKKYKMHLMFLMSVMVTYCDRDPRNRTYGNPNAFPDVKTAVKLMLKEHGSNYKTAILRAMTFARDKNWYHTGLSEEEREFFKANTHGNLIGIIFQLIDNECQESSDKNACIKQTLEGDYGKMILLATQPQKNLLTQSDHERLIELCNTYGSDLGLASHVFKELINEQTK